MKIVPCFSDEINKTKEKDTLEFEKRCALTNSRPQVYGFLVLLLRS
jgi:hypothetical protein